MEQLIFGTVQVDMKPVKTKFRMVLTDDACNRVQFDELSQQEAELLNRTVRNLNTLARDCDIATVLAFEREGIDEVPDLVKDKADACEEDDDDEDVNYDDSIVDGDDE